MVFVTVVHVPTPGWIAKYKLFSSMFDYKIVKLETRPIVMRPNRENVGLFVTGYSSCCTSLTRHEVTFKRIKCRFNIMALVTWRRY